jgi:hypothetical protein
MPATGNGISGRGGDVLIGTGPTPTQVVEITKWSFNPKATNPGYRSNRTQGFTKRVPGYKDASGSIEGKWDPTNPITAVIDIAQSVTLNLQFVGTQRIIAPALVDSIKLDVNLDTAEIIGWSIDFSADGPWTWPAATTPLLGPGMGEASGTPGPGAAEQPAPAGQPQPPQPAAPQPGAPPQPAAPPQQPQGVRPVQAAAAPQTPQLSPEMVTQVTHAVIQALAAQGLLGQQPGARDQGGMTALAA